MPEIGPPTLESAFGQSPGSITPPGMGAVAAPDAADSEAARAPAGGPKLSSDEQQIIDRLAGNQHPATGAPPSSLLPQQSGLEFQGGAPLSDQSMASVGRSPEEQAQILGRVYGAGNTMVQNGRVYFKRPGDPQFQPVSAEMGDFLKDVTHWDMGNAAISGQSLLASHTADLTTIARGVGGSILGGAIGAKIGGPMGMLGGTVLGSGVAAAYDSEQKSLAIDKLLNKHTDPTVVNDDATKAFMADAVVNGGAMVVGTAIKGFGKGIQTIIDQAPMNRAKSSVLLEDELNKFASSLGSKSLSDSGDFIAGALAQRKKAIGQMYIGKYDTMVEQLAKDANAKVPVDDVLDKMRTLLQDKAGVQFNGMVPVAAYDTKIPNMSFLGQSREGGISFDQLMAERPQEQSLNTSMFTGLAPFGSKNGQQAMQVILDDYASLLQAKQAQGGLDVNVFRRMEQKYGSLGDYSEGNPFKDISSSVMNQIDKSFGDTRSQFYQQVLGGQNSPQGQQYLQDWAKYGAEKDAITRLYDVFGDSKWTPELAVERAINTNNPKPIQDLKLIYGNNPDIMGPLQGSVVQKALGDSINTKTGLPDLQQFAQKINAYNKSNPSVLDEIFNPGDRRILQSMTNRAAKVMTSDINSDADKGAIRGMFNLIFDSGRAVTGLSPSPFAVTRDLYSFFSQNTNAYKYLTETLLPERLAIAQKGKDMVLANNIGSVLESLGSFASMSKVVQVGSRQMYVPNVAFRETLIHIAKGQNAGSGKTSVQPIQTQDTGR